MIATNHKHAAKRASVLMLATAMTGCTTDPAPSPSESERTGVTKQATTTSLPVRDFVQLPSVCPGSAHDLETFASGDVLVATAAGTTGQVALSIRAPGGATTALAGPAHYATRPTKVDVTGHRVACATRAALIPRGIGPKGDVFSYDKAQGMKIVCWYSPNGAATWTETIVAQAAPGEPTDAFWPVLYDEAEVNDVVVPGAFDVVYMRDADYAPWEKTAAARATREHAYFARVTMATGQVSVYDQESYPDWTTSADSIVGPPSCTGTCGMRSNGMTWTDCGPCAAGTYCNEGACSATICTPRATSDVCIDKPGAPACGTRSDGCGGIVQCSSCPSGLACGAAGDPKYCGARVRPMSEAKVRELYKDKNGRLCGTLQDPATGVPVTMTSTCSQCVNNVCRDTPMPSCIPSGAL